MTQSNDDRDPWWRLEQVRAIAARRGLDRVQAAVDIGCGLGGWTRVMAQVLPAGALLVGLEREPATSRAAVARGDRGIEYRVGSAEALTFTDASLDLVTAESLMSQVADPRQVLIEMARVLRPGGTLWLVEANQLVCRISQLADPATDPDLAAAAFKLELICQRGKHALGLGFGSLGERLVGQLDPALWRDVRVELCDRVAVVAPPYRAADAEPALPWTRDEAENYFYANYYGEGSFAAMWDAVVALQQARGEAIRAGTYAAAEGQLVYAITATKI
jgi:SAM-dependent methyltransferase